MISAVKSSIAEVNRDISLQFKTFALQVDESLARERLLATLSGFFGGLALVLAMIGLYGVMSYNVTRRRNEIGIRMALGPNAARVLAYGHGRSGPSDRHRPHGLGWAAALVATRLVSSFLYGLSRTIQLTLTLAIALLAGVASPGRLSTGAPRITPGAADRSAGGMI